MNGGETRANISGWTVDTLHAHVQTLIDERDRQYKERFVSQERASQLALDAARGALLKAEASIDRRLENTNEWRAAMSDRDMKLLTRQEFDSVLKEWTTWRQDSMGELSKRVTIMETRAITWTAALGVVFIIVQILLRTWSFIK